jgi:MATE family multidrug resistance protein
LPVDLAGVVRGCGQQKIGAFVNLAAYYLVGIPASFFFTFVCYLGGMVRIYVVMY